MRVRIIEGVVVLIGCRLRHVLRDHQSLTVRARTMFFDFVTQKFFGWTRSFHLLHMTNRHEDAVKDRTMSEEKGGNAKSGRTGRS